MVRIVFDDADTRYVFIYGPLKPGFTNHKVIEDLVYYDNAIHMGSYTTVGSFPLVCGPHGIPYMIHRLGSGHHVKGELYFVAATGRTRIEDLDFVGLGHYESRPLVVTAPAEGGVKLFVEALAYFAHRDFGEALWKRCGEKGYGEYNEEMGSKYVKPKNRPRGSNVIKDIQSFIKETVSTD